MSKGGRAAYRPVDEHRRTFAAVLSGGLAVHQYCIESAPGKSVHSPVKTGATWRSIVGQEQRYGLGEHSQILYFGREPA